MATSWFVYVTIGLVGLAQVPIGIDLLRFMFPEWKIARFAGKVIHHLLFTVMGSIFIIGLSYHLFLFLPLLVGSGSIISFQGLSHIVFALWVWMNTVGNYYYAVWLHPGMKQDHRPPLEETKDCGRSEEDEGSKVKDSMTITRAKLRSSQESGASKRDYILPMNCNSSQNQSSLVLRPKTGDLWVPKRTHYCKICACAIPYLDHHCPFTGNCAGLRNYFNFFLSLFYGTIGLFYAVVITLPYFFECNLKSVLWYFGIVNSRESKPICEQLGPHSHIFLPVFAGFLISLNMLLLQIVFLLSDLSTYNILRNWSKYPVLRFMLQRIQARKFQDKDSRVNTLMINGRNISGYLFPSSSS